MQKSSNRLRRGTTIIASLLFVALGIWLMLDPSAVESLYPMTLDKPMAVSEIRAVFGGLMTGCGLAVLALDLIIGRHRDAAMVLALITAGLVIARVVGLVFEGMPSGPVLNETVFEVVLLSILIATGAFNREA